MTVSNLEVNKMEEFGAQEKIEFDQNSVPFDYNGDLLSWMQYLDDGVREMYTYDFNKRERQTVLKFTKNEGIISHGKLAGTYPDHQRVLYVQNTNQIMQYDVKT